ncbi:MAG: phage regulatory protein/antirepressor Ant [Alphaproteobacteria bacterium]|jgi:Rha family phage regulatory protein|nr:phage regulatory protein/antirepressor Ant [Alphaproteobacteria bacterium]
MPNLIPVVSIAGDRVVANSRDVAEYFGKKHRNVLAAIDAMIAAQPTISPLTFKQGVYRLPETADQEHRCFEMGRDGFTLLAMGFTGSKALAFKLKYIEAFNAMEAELRPRQALPDLSDPVVLQDLLATQLQRRIDAEKKVAELIPKAVALDRIAAAKGTLTLRDAAKVLGQKPKAFVATLLRERWIYRQNGSGRLIGYQDKVDRGLVDHRFHIYESEGADKASSQAVITAKGLAVLGEKLGAGQQLGFNLH